MASTFDKTTHTTKWIPVKQLSVIWISAQRAIDQKWVKELCAKFDPDLFEAVAVSLPDANGMHHIIDGQHRVEVIRQLYGEEEKVPCHVFNARDPARAAQLFDRLSSGRKKLQRIDMFRVRVTAGYSDEVEIDRIVRSLGYKIDFSKRDGHIAAVDALLYVYKRHGSDVLRYALNLIKSTWGPDSNAVVAPIIRGYGSLVAEHGQHLDFERLIDRVSKKFTPGRLIGAARNMREAMQCSIEIATKQVIINAYNHGLRATAKLGDRDAA